MIHLEFPFPPFEYLTFESGVEESYLEIEPDSDENNNDIYVDKIKINNKNNKEESDNKNMVLLQSQEKKSVEFSRLHDVRWDISPTKIKPFKWMRNTLRHDTIPEERPDYFTKIVLLGDPCTGKTSLLNYLQCGPCSKKRCQNLESCISRFKHFVERTFTVSEKVVLTRIYDTAGQEKYRSLTASYYRGAHGCLILYDVTKESSFENLSHWLADLKEYTTQPEISTIIVGTKCHVPEDRREVTFERAQKFAESLNIPYMEVSAEEGINITEVFEKLADLIIESLNKDAVLTQIQQKNVILDSKPTKKKQQWCSC